MNTKYPINGRYTTLGDLVEDYAKYSSIKIVKSTTSHPTYISTKVKDTNYIFFTENKISNLKNKRDMYAYKTMPFPKLIYSHGISADADTPYELVWFDNIYS